jgi:hypothetical protein
MANSGATTAIIGQQLGHKSARSTKIYERLRLATVRQELNQAMAPMRLLNA